MSRCGSASALSSFADLWGVAVLSTFLTAMGLLAHGGGAMENHVNLQRDQTRV